MLLQRFDQGFFPFWILYGQELLLYCKFIFSVHLQANGPILPSVLLLFVRLPLT